MPRVVIGVVLNITVISYMDSVVIGWICDREMIVDPWELVDGVHASLDELTAMDREEARQARRRYRGVSQAR